MKTNKEKIKWLKGRLEISLDNVKVLKGYYNTECRKQRESKFSEESIYWEKLSKATRAMIESERQIIGWIVTTYLELDKENEDDD